MSDDELLLHPPRYWRCQSKDCGRKWHRMSLSAYRAPITIFNDPAPDDLFSNQPVTVAIVMDGTICPACKAPMEPEPGFVYGDHPPPRFEIKTADNAKWSYIE